MKALFEKKYNIQFQAWKDQIHYIIVKEGICSTMEKETQGRAIIAYSSTTQLSSRYIA